MGKKKKKHRRKAIGSGSSPASSRVRTDVETVQGAQRIPLVHGASFVAMALITCLLYADALHLGFFEIDDKQYVVKNELIQKVDADNITRILTAPYFTNYSPLHLLSYMIDHAIDGSNAYVFHLSNNIWAGIVAGFVYILAFSIFGYWLPSFVAALLFIVHPAHVETVAWISSRKDLIAAAFAIPALLTYRRYSRGGEHARYWYMASLGLYLLAVSGKLSVIVIPVVFILFDYLIDGRRGWSLLVDKIPFGIIASIFALIVMRSQPGTGSAPGLLTIAHTSLHSLWLSTGLGEYVLSRPPLDVANLPLVFQLTYPGLFFGVLFLPVIISRRLSPHFLLFYYWIIVALVPFQVLSVPVADRYVFFPSIPLVLLLVCGLRHLGESFRTRHGSLLLILLSLPVGAIWYGKTWSYMQEWTDPRSVWFHVVPKLQDEAAYLQLGTHYHVSALAIERGATRGESLPERVTELVAHIWKDTRKQSAFLNEWAPGRSGGGPVTRETVELLLDMAWDAFEKGAEENTGRPFPNLYYRRGMIQFRRSNYEEARKEFRIAYEHALKKRYSPISWESQVRISHALGVIAWQERDYQEARSQMIKAMEIQTRHDESWIPNIRDQIDQLDEKIESRVDVGDSD